jgi:hypothetical protein
VGRVTRFFFRVVGSQDRVPLDGFADAAESLTNDDVVGRGQAEHPSRSRACYCGLLSVAAKILRFALAGSDSDCNARVSWSGRANRNR